MKLRIADRVKFKNGFSGYIRSMGITYDPKDDKTREYVIVVVNKKEKDLSLKEFKNAVVAC
jgi:hypothetical protein